MLKIELSIHTSEDAVRASETFIDQLNKSNLGSNTKDFLQIAVCETLKLWSEQLSSPQTGKLSSRKSFIGENYRINIRVKSPPNGLQNALRFFLGIFR